MTEPELSAPAQSKMIDEAAVCKEYGLSQDPPYTPVGCPCACHVVPDNHQAAYFCCGKYVGTDPNPGLRIIGCCNEPRHVSFKKFTLDVAKVKVTDAKGSPIVVSAVVQYRATSAKKPLVDVSEPWPEPGVERSFLELQANAVMKTVCAHFPYESVGGEPSLLAGKGVVEKALRDEMQRAALPTGVIVYSYDVTDLSYAPEIAQAMLQRQQAEAMIVARNLIVDAAVSITHTALEKLRGLGHKIEGAAEDRITANLLTVICSGSAAMPTVPL